MSLSPNGSNLFSQSHSFTMDDLSQVGEARRFASYMSATLDFDEIRAARVSIIISELGNNLVKYAQMGQIILRGCRCETGGYIEILSIDKGPGIENIGRVLADGFTTGSTPGTGLGSIQRQSSIFDIFSVLGQGSVILSIVASDEVLLNPDYQVGAVSIPIKGEVVCGDGWYTQESNENLSVLMVDGLGHGTNAHQAAVQAIEAFAHSTETTVEQKLQLIHGRLKSTRGAAVFLVECQRGTDLTYVGVGNIRAVLSSAESTKALISQNGTAGLQIRKTTPMTQKWGEDSLLVLHSDGITGRWDFLPYPGLTTHHPSIIAAVVYRDFNRGNDDATVLVVRKRRES